MMNMELLVISFLLFKIPSTLSMELPKYIKKCSIKRNFRECVIKHANDAIPYIVKGDPDYDVPNMLPLRVPFVSLINGSQVVLNVTDLEIYGLEQTKVTDLKLNNKKSMYFTIVLEAPNVTITGNYTVHGNVMMIPLDGTGRFSLYLKNGVYTYPNSFKEVEFDGEKYYQIDQQRLIFKFEGVIFDLGNFFNGDPILGTQINKFLNENWEVLIQDFGPGIAQTISAVITQVFNGIARRVPKKNIFLSD